MEVDVDVSVEMWSVAMLVQANLAQVDSWCAKFRKQQFRMDSMLIAMNRPSCASLAHEFRRDGDTQRPISLKYPECADEEVETTPIIHAQTVWTIEVEQTSDAALHRKCLISKLSFANAIWVLPDCKKGKALSMLEYTSHVLMFVHALLFAISLHQCPEFEEQRRSRIFYVGFSACISNCWPTRMRSCYGWFVAW